MLTSLFVYGTQLSAHEQGGYLARVPRAPAWVDGRLYDLPAGYPALVVDVGAGEERLRVWGELAGPVDEPVLALLDLCEGVGQGLFERRTIEVHCGPRAQRAWAYVMDPARARAGRLLAHGRWRPVRRR